MIGEGTDEEILAAAEACPALAITVTDAETGEVVFLRPGALSPGGCGCNP